MLKNCDIENAKFKRVGKVLKQLHKLRNEYPEYTIIIETPDGSVDCKIKDAHIYEGCGDCLVFDAE